MLPELTIPVDLAQDLLLSLPQQLDDSTLRDLFNCCVYRKYGPEVLVGQINYPYVIDAQHNILFKAKPEPQESEGEYPTDSSRDTCLRESVLKGVSPLTVCHLV